MAGVLLVPVGMPFLVELLARQLFPLVAVAVLPLGVNDRSAALTLVYVDDVIARFVELMDGADEAVGPDGFASVGPHYTTAVGALADLLQSFKEGRGTQMTERVGAGLVRALYATYVSYLPVEMVVMLWANEVFDRERPDTFACAV